MIEALQVMLSYAILRRALAVGCLVALLAALIGVSLVLKRYSMIGDGLSHVGFGAMAVATALNAAPLMVATPVVIAAAFFLLRLRDNGHLKGDAAIAMISSASLSIGVLIVSLSGVNTDLNSYMFGSILSLSRADARLSLILGGAALLLFVLFYHRIFAVTFDEDFARATGTRASLCSTLLAVLTAVVVVLGMRMMGALLISSLIIFPPLSAMQVGRSFSSVTIIAAAISLVCFIVGMLLSFMWAAPSGAMIVVVNVVAYMIFAIVGYMKRR